MSLQIWLPLNGDLHNQGLLKSQPIVSGSTSFTDGKIGQALNCNGSSYWNISGLTLGAEASICCWKKTSTSGKMSWVLVSDANDRLNLYESSIYTLNNGDSNNNPFQDNGTSISVLTDGKWHHFTVTFGNSVAKLYIDGVYRGTAKTFRNPTTTNKSIRVAGGYVGGHSYDFNGQINDFRVYDHCLSTKEVEEISKGLVLHYKLDQNVNTLTNCYNQPKFNTSAAAGGWSHWGPSGHAGRYGQNTDKQYIFDKRNTYSHWVDNIASASGKYYLLYQSPAFDGGYRSIQFIIKEQNSLPITESICSPGWNARSGGAPANTWTSIEPLGDGFYLCKVNGVSQDGSNDLIGINVQPGYKIYVSEGYCENNKEFCSDLFNQDNLTIVYDSSGYQNNGQNAGITSINISGRYDIGTVFSGSSSYIKVLNNNWLSQGMKEITINLWAKASAWPTTGRLFSCTESGGFNLEAGNSGYWRFPVHVYTNSAQSTTAYKYDSKEIQISALPINEWVMITLIYDGTGTRSYINGELHHTYSNVSYGIHFNTNARLFLGCEANTANPSTPYFAGQMSDFRIYTTALTENQIKELYSTSVTIDNFGNGYAREEIEKDTLSITKTGIFYNNEIIEDDSNTTASITKVDKQFKVNNFYEY